MKKAIIILIAPFLCIWTVWVFISIRNNYWSYDWLSWLIILCTVALPYVVAFFILWKSRKVKKETAAVQRLNQQRNQELLDKLKNARVSDLVPIQSPVGIFLGPGEACFFQCPASSVEIKEKTVGYQNSSAGVSFRIAKGVSLRSSGGKATPIRKNVTTLYHGVFSITNKRLIMVSSKGGFDTPVSKITSIMPTANSVLFQFGSKQYNIQMSDMEVVMEVIRIVRAEYVALEGKRR